MESQRAALASSMTRLMNTKVITLWQQIIIGSIKKLIYSVILTLPKDFLPQATQGSFCPNTRSSVLKKQKMVFI
ncbi:hypothetical protein BTJ40_10990 [Microbulbifer sp. A4B17]|nr:hypothetical protein BTJ40_10990 [Microbulbifer sp. A4B17]